MSKALVAIVGPSGSGKSTSLRNLNPATTRIIDLERKGLPFPNASRFVVWQASNIPELEQHIVKALSDTTIEVIIIESLTKYFEILLRLMQTSYKGYEIYAQYNKCIGNFLDRLKNDHATIVFTAIDEIVRIPSVDGSETSQRRIRVGGKQWEGMIEKEMLMVMFTEMRRDKATGRTTYHFQTNSDGTTSSKTPMGMFEEQLIDNDLAMVIDRAKRYYQPTTPPTT